jgi:hypothetical protein
MIERLPSKRNALSLNPAVQKKKKRSIKSTYLLIPAIVYERAYLLPAFRNTEYLFTICFKKACTKINQ